jgi:hypothetical protein
VKNPAFGAGNTQACPISSGSLLDVFPVDQQVADKEDKNAGKGGSAAPVCNSRSLPA